MDEAAKRGINVSVEGHIGSNVDTPGKLARLIDLTPGFKLTLDYTHFTYAGFNDAEIEPLLVHARHFHLRGGAKGKVQAAFKENTINYRRVIERMKEIGYNGYLGLEYVWMNWLDCNQTENICETIQFRDFARAVLAGHEYAPVVLTA